MREVRAMAFASIKPALKYIALLRAYEGQGSSGGEAIYSAPVMIKCYPSVENSFVLNEIGGAMVSKSVLYVSGDVPVKAQDIIILENASPNWFGKDFESHIERNEYYTSNPQKLIANKTWCCVRGEAQYWNGFKWSKKFDSIETDCGSKCGFLGKTDTVKSVPKYFDGFGWENDAELDGGLSLQEIAL